MGAGPSVPLLDSRQALLAERRMTPDEVWDAAEARLDRSVREGLNIAHEVSDRWARDRGRLAMVVARPDGRGERWTFADLTRASCRFANVLVRAGLRPGDRVAAVVSRQAEAYVCALGAWRAGMVYMPLFAGFGEHALAQRLNAAHASALIVDHPYRETVEKARALLIDDPFVLTISGEDGRGMLPGDRDVWAEIDRSAPEFDTVETAASDLCTLLFTSGTTGAPKGCEMPHGLIVSVQPFVRHVFGLGAGDMLFAAADPGWGYGLITTGVSVMALGLPRVIYPGPYDPKVWLDIFEREQVTYPAAAPTAYRRIVELAASGSGLPAAVRGGTCAGEPLDAPLTTAWGALGAGPLQDGYGLTEAGMVLANLAFDETEPIPGALSSVVPGFEIGLVDDEGRDAGQQGVIAVRRSRWAPTTGYWDEPAKWAARWRGDWQLSGDVARRDEAGRWWFVGRDDDLIVTSGYNVGPSEVENIVLALPEVLDAGVVAAPDPSRGSVVRAVVVATPGADRSALTTAIKDAVRARLGRHAYPRIIDFADELPRTETGKLKRAALREPAPESARAVETFAALTCTDRSV